MADTPTPKPPTATPHPPPPSHVPPVPPRGGRIAERQAMKHDPDTVAAAEAGREYHPGPTADNPDVEPILADPIQVVHGMLHPPAVIDESLLPENQEAQDSSDDAAVAKHRIMNPDEPDPATVTGVTQNRFEVLTGKRVQRDDEAADKGDKKAKKAADKDKKDEKNEKAHHATA